MLRACARVLSGNPGTHTLIASRQSTAEIFLIYLCVPHSMLAPKSRQCLCSVSAARPRENALSKHTHTHTHAPNTFPSDPAFSHVRAHHQRHFIFALNCNARCGVRHLRAACCGRAGGRARARSMCLLAPIRECFSRAYRHIIMASVSRAFVALRLSCLLPPSWCTRNGMQTFAAFRMLCVCVFFVVRARGPGQGRAGLPKPAITYRIAAVCMRTHWTNRNGCCIALRYWFI